LAQGVSSLFSLGRCSDVERGFAKWRRHPEDIVGFFPRSVLSDGSYLYERDVFRRGKYNVMLTAAEFFDSRYLSWYWAPELESARALVDELRNCEDILMNFVVATGLLARQDATETEAAKPIIGGGESEGDDGQSAPPPPSHQQWAMTRYIRPRRRLDISKLSGVGISRNSGAHDAKRRACVAEFAKSFGGVPMAEVPIDWRRQPAGRPWCFPLLGCVYL
jgi:hypothetical protein